MLTLFIQYCILSHNARGVRHMDRDVSIGTSPCGAVQLSVVLFHASADIFFKTPCLLQPLSCSLLVQSTHSEPASHIFPPATVVHLENMQSPFHFQQPRGTQPAAHMPFALSRVPAQLSITSCSALQNLSTISTFYSTDLCLILAALSFQNRLPTN